MQPNTNQKIWLHACWGGLLIPALKADEAKGQEHHKPIQRRRQRRAKSTMIMIWLTGGGGGGDDNNYDDMTDDDDVTNGLLKHCQSMHTLYGNGWLGDINSQ